MTAFTRIDFNPLLDWQILLPLFAAAVVLLALAYWRGAGAPAWRALALADGFVALLNPSVVEEQRRALKDIALIIADQSPSQKIGSRGEVQLIHVTQV